MKKKLFLIMFIIMVINISSANAGSIGYASKEELKNLPNACENAIDSVFSNATSLSGNVTVTGEGSVKCPNCEVYGIDSYISVNFKVELPVVTNSKIPTEFSEWEIIEKQDHSMFSCNCGYNFQPSELNKKMLYADSIGGYNNITIGGKSYFVNVAEVTEIVNNKMGKNTSKNPYFIINDSGKIAIIVYEDKDIKHMTSKDNVPVHGLGEKCVKCGQSHVKKDLVEDDGDENNHYFSCKFNGCNEKIQESHTGGNHDNGGECSACKKPYQTHNIVYSTCEYDSNTNKHLFKCSYKDCEVYIEEEHEKDENKIEHEGDYHWYRCVTDGCEIKFDEVEHLDAGNGICKECGATLKKLEELVVKDGNSIVGGEIELEEGKSTKLQITYTPEDLDESDFSWEIVDENVATVTPDGTIKGKSEGETTLNIYWKEELQESISISVKAKSFEIRAEKNTVKEGEDIKISIISESVTGDEVSWSINVAEKIATITKKRDGAIFSAISGGSTSSGVKITITAKLENGLTKKTEVTIKHSKIVHNINESYAKCSECDNVIIDHKVSDTYEKWDEEYHYRVCSDCPDKLFDKKAHTGSKKCTECNWEKEVEEPEINITPKPETNVNNSNIEWDWDTVGIYHWPKGKKEEASYHDSATHCPTCGWSKKSQQEELAKTCTHPEQSKKYTSLSNQKHKITCGLCGIVIAEAASCDGPPCSKCSGKTKETDGDFSIKQKVFYIKEGERLTITPEIILKNGSPNFEWTMDTKKVDNYNPSSPDSSPYKKFHNGDTSSDDTIKFWYSNGKFYAELEENNRSYLSGEVNIRIKLLNNGDVQTIKIIKDGPPRSNCSVFVENPYVVKGNEQYIYLVAKTNYPDFENKKVLELRNEHGEDLYPFYGIEINEVKINGRNISNIGEPELQTVENGDFNGYLVKIKAPNMELGTQKINVSFTTSYTYSKHATKKEYRNFTGELYIVEKEEDIPEIVTPPGGETPPGGGEGNGNGGALAGIGVLGLLIVAVVGAKMFGRR